jgi:hypothetical protein
MILTTHQMGKMEWLELKETAGRFGLIFLTNTVAVHLSFWNQNFSQLTKTIHFTPAMYSRFAEIGQNLCLGRTV